MLRPLRPGLAALVLATGLAARAGLEVNAPDNNPPGPKIDVPNPTTGGGGKPGDASRGPLDEVLRFKNGDALHGNLVRIQAETGLTWRRPDVTAPIVTALTNLRGVKLFRQATAAEPSGARLELTNDDVLYGTLVKMTKDDLEFETWYAGKLIIPTVMVRSLCPGSKEGSLLLHSGLGALTDWSHRNGEWTVNGTRFECASGQLGRDLKLPDQVHVSLDVGWGGPYPSFSVVTHPGNVQRYYEDGYNVQFNSQYIYLYRGTNQEFGQITYNQLRGMHKAHLDIYVDKPGKRVGLLINGALVKEWSGLNFVANGTGLVLISHGGYGPTSFSNLRVMRWDGKLPNEPAAAGGATTEDLVHFTNGDKMSGQVLEIANGKVLLKPGFADAIPVPAENVTQISFGEGKAERARRNAADAQLYFANGEHVTVELLELKDGKITGKSENFGAVRQLDLRAFAGMRFNIYDEEPAGTDGSFQDFLLND